MINVVCIEGGIYPQKCQLYSDKPWRSQSLQCEAEPLCDPVCSTAKDVTSVSLHFIFMSTASGSLLHMPNKVSTAYLNPDFLVEFS